jgi:hypothetical protein
MNQIEKSITLKRNGLFCAGTKGKEVRGMQAE